MCLTYPHIGNVGTNRDDEESPKPYIEGLIVREFSRLASNWRSTETAQAYLERHGVPVIWDLDTRALVRHLRDVGALRGDRRHRRRSRRKIDRRSRHFRRWPARNSRAASPRRKYIVVEGFDRSAPLRHAAERANGPAQVQLKGTVADALSRGRIRFRHQAEYFAALVDHGCDVTVVPAKTSAEDVLAMKPHGVFLSNGPGDPEPIHYAIENIRKLLGRVPIFGICLGHQLCGLALGGKTFKLKFGHHGSNHPVKNLLTQKVEITSQNHGFCVDPDSLPSSDVEITHVNLNDHTNEGMRHRSLPLFSVQYHPEASPGPHDARYLFNDFITHDERGIERLRNG